MNKISIKTLAAIFSIGGLATYSVIYACADWDWGYDYDSSFTPEVYVDKSYKPLFFAPGDVFYDIGFDRGYTGRFNDEMVADWKTQLKGKVTDDQVQALLLSDPEKGEAEKLYAAASKNQPLPAPYNTLNASDEKVKSFIEFLHYAKAIEASCTTPADDWSYDPVKPNPPASAVVLAQIEKRYNETKDPFVKNRYWFQAMKAYFYGVDKTKVIGYFDKTKGAVPQNALYYRGLAYVAGAYYRQKNYAMSNYLYSVVFDKCAPLRVVAANNFHPQEQTDFNASLALAKTPEEKAGLWALIGYYADEKAAIREIYKINPASPHLDFLATRLVNKEEVKLNGQLGESTFASAAAYRKAVASQLDADALQLATTMANEGKTARPYLWNMAAGYLSTLAGNYKVATQYYDKVEKEAPKSALAFQQLRMLRLVNTISALDRIDAKAESTLLAELDWFYNAADKQEALRTTRAKSWSKQYIAALYLGQQNVVMAELFNPNEKYYQTPANLDAMKAFQQKASKTSWEAFAARLYSITLSNIFEYQAIMSAYEGKMDAAIAFMEQSADGGNTELMGNPFNGKIKDCHDCDHAATQKVKYNKVAFLKKMKEMLTYIEMNQDVYNNSLLVANGYYNMTFYGNARVFYYSPIVNQYGNDINTFYESSLRNCNLARKYYQKAFDAATTPEQKAKCQYMLAKCDRNDYYTSTFHSDEADEDRAFQAWPGFKKLKSDYANTKYYQDVINECGYFRKYLKLE